MQQSGKLPQQRQMGIASVAAYFLDRRWAKFALIATTLIFLCFGIWPFALAHLQAIAVLKLVSQQHVPWLIGAVVAEPITTEDITLPDGVRARLYLPTNKPNAPPMLVFHGVHHLGMNEPRLEAFAAALASCGLRVLTPEMPSIKDYRIDATSIRTIGEATQWFAVKTGRPAGVLGLSFSGGLALIAAADPAYSPSFKFVVALGSQDNMAHVADYYLTGQELRPDGTIERLTPHEYGALVLEYEHLEDFVPVSDVEAVRLVLREHLYEDKVAEAKAFSRLTSAQTVEARQLLDSNSQVTRACEQPSSSRYGRPLPIWSFSLADYPGLSAPRAGGQYHPRRRDPLDRPRTSGSYAQGYAGQPSAVAPRPRWDPAGNRGPATAYSFFGVSHAS